MDSGALLRLYTVLASPAAFAALAGLAVMLVWLAFMPGRPARQVDNRLEGYLEPTNPAGDEAEPALRGPRPSPAPAAAYAYLRAHRPTA
jgi:hypothetical protein